MNQSSKILALTNALYLSISFPYVSFGAPFGLTMGMRLADFNEIELTEIGGTQYVATNLPRNHSAFDSYVLQIHPVTGLCLIRAIGKDIESSSHGTELVSAFDELHNQLDSAYGDSRLVSFLRSGSIWDEPEDYMRAIENKERVLQAIWERDDGSVIGNEVVEVILEARASSSRRGQVIVQYRLENERECAQLVTEDEVDAL